MLFYNENDEICLKLDGGWYKVLYDHQYNYFELNGGWYNYTNGYFYEATECDGDLDTYWDKRNHPRHMNIVEIDEAFAPPSYKDQILNEVFKYDDSLKEESYYIMYTIARKVNEALSKWNTYITCNVEKMEFEELGKEGVFKVLSLLHEEYKYDIEFSENPKEYEDRASIFVYWEYEEV